MKNMILAALALAVLPSTAFAGYDLSAKNIEAETPVAASTVDSGTLLPLYNTDSGDAELIAGDDIPAIMGVKAYETVAATNTLTTAECGKVMTLAHATEFATTLPAPTAGCEFKFIVGLAPSGASYTIKTSDNQETIKGVAFDMTGGAVAAGAGTAAADTITLVDGAALAGDLVNLFSDGTSWHGLAFSSASGAITYTSAQ